MANPMITFNHWSCDLSTQLQIELEANLLDENVNELVIQNVVETHPSEGSGEFIAKEKGVYDFSVTFLMKTDYEGSVKVSLKRNDVTISKTELSFDGNGNGKVGTTSTLSAVLLLLENDKVFLELEAEGQGGMKWALLLKAIHFVNSVCTIFSL